MSLPVGSSQAEREPGALAYVGLGANLGEPRQQLARAIDAIEALPRTRVLARSRFYSSTPIDADGPRFVNAVIAVSSGLSPRALLDALHAIEQAALRERPYRNAPRTLDLDLLLYGTEMIDDPRLCLPHPRMAQRAFVLRPLAEIAPAIEIPGRGPIAELLEHVADQDATPMEEHA
ncbi:MAG: 2-amino-4-hydroxy-6-hydroxymethyldihydropteridine diphosphokinase [Burkholderiaceae bacterium]